jgi:hypothetical protein
VIGGVFAALVWLALAVLVTMPLEDACYCGAPDCDCVGFGESGQDGAR